MSQGHNGSSAIATTPSLAFNKACEIEDFEHPDLLSVLRDIAAHKVAAFSPDFPRGAEHRKDWEIAMAVRTLHQFGALRPEATVLGVAAGTEDTLFYLTRHVRQVYATDRYLASEEWQPVAPISMLVDPSSVAPFEFHPERLVVQHMDGRRLWFPDDTFDGVFSSGSIEHFGDLHDIASAAYEMGRVLKPGGVLTLSTEVRLAGPAGGIGWPGLTVVFPPEHLRRYIIEASGLEPVDELITEVSAATMASPRVLTDAIGDHHARMAAGDGTAEYACWDFPHLVLRHEDYTFTSVHLALRKPTHYPVIPNAWAKPSDETVAAIREHSRAIIARAAAGPAPTSPTVTPQVAEVSVEAFSAPGASGDSWEARQAQLEAALVAVGVTAQKVQGIREELARDKLEADHQLDLIDDNRTAVDDALKVLHGLSVSTDDPVTSGHGGELPTADAGAPAHHYATVTLAEGLRFEVAIDPEIGDPVTEALSGGYTLDQNLVSLMLQLIEPGDRVLDLGAHVGTFALAASAKGAAALAVEASPGNAALVRASSVRNRFPNLRVVHAAASDAHGTVDFSAYGPWGHVASTPTSVKVPSVTLSDLLMEMRWLPLHFIKMDIEGFEIRALRGMAEVLRSSDAPPIIYESNGHTLAFYDYTTMDLLKELKSLGYTSYMIEPGRLIRADPEAIQPQTIVDYLAVKPGPMGLSGWTVEDFLEPSEQVAKIVADLGNANEHHRAYMAAALRQGGDLLENPEIVRGLDALLEDPVAVVQEAARWWTKARVTKERSEV